MVTSVSTRLRSLLRRICKLEVEEFELASNAVAASRVVLSANQAGLAHRAADSWTVCQTLMVLVGTRQTLASLQPFPASSVLAPTDIRLQLGRQRKGLPAFSFLIQSRTRRFARSVVSSAISADLLSVGFFSAASAGLLYSATPLLTGKAKQANQGKKDGYGETDSDPEDIKWGVMSVVSFIPLVNWTVSCKECMSCLDFTLFFTFLCEFAGLGFCRH